MANTLETLLHRELQGSCRLNKISQLIKQRVDCNWTYFNSKTCQFLSPIQMAVKTGNTSVICLLYENRNYPTEKYLQEQLNFYNNYYCTLQEDNNASLLEYIVNCLLHLNLMSYSVKDYDILLSALHDYDNVVKRGEELSIGSHPKIFLSLRIFSLIRRILQMHVESLIEFNKNEFLIMKKELLYNLEIHYLIQDIDSIPVYATDEIKKTSFKEMEEPYRSLYKKHYEYIAKNVIKRIKQLKIDEEYTIPSGWSDHSICVSFRCINQTHVHIRVDNPSSINPFTTNKTNQTIDQYRRIKSKILGQLSLSDLDINLDYFVLLMDTVVRDIPINDGWSLIYNTNQIIDRLEKGHDEELPDILEQASANCFVKCFEFGFRLRIGQEHEKLCEKLLAFEKDSVQWLKTRCEQKDQRSPTSYYIRYALLDNQNKKNPFIIEGKSQLQNKLKASYNQKYQYLPSFIIGEYNNSLMDKYVALKFKSDHIKQIAVENLFIKPRVLVLADAGCGKTTICEYITYSWSLNKLWKNKFKWLFYIKIRNLNSTFYSRRHENNDYLLLDIIEKECFQGYRLSSLDKNRLQIQLENPSNILWILDGLDEQEIVPDYLQSIVFELLAKPNLLLTSRPYVRDDFQYDIKLKIEKFTTEDIEEFVGKYFTEMSAETVRDCYSFIQSSQQLHETAQTPACLLIICNLWENRSETLDYIISIEELYHKMCECLLQRYLIKFHGMKKSTLAGKDIFQESASIGFVHLEYLAFKATESDQLTISSRQIRTITNGLLFPIVDIGLLISDRKSSFLSFLDNNYTFIHRSFQEYLCCRYMIKTLTSSSSSSSEQQDEVFQFIANRKYNRYVRDTFRLFFQMENAKYCTEKFWSAVDSQPLDLVGLRHCSRICDWFPLGSYANPDEEDNINKRTIDVVTSWISNKDRRAHDFGNTYLFEWFYKIIPHYSWWIAWREDLFIEDSSERRYFLSDLWSSENIVVLRKIYDSIPFKKVEALHRLIKKGPTIVTLKDLQLDYNQFSLETINDQTEILAKLLKKARKRQEITTLTEFQTLLQNYDLFAQLYRQRTVHDVELWPLKIAASLLININEDTLKLLRKFTEENFLFYRNILLPVIPLMKLYVVSNKTSEDTLCSLIISVSFSSTCILTAPPSQTKLIRIFENDKVQDIELSEKRWKKLIKAFEDARNIYQYSCFFVNN